MSGIVHPGIPAQMLRQNVKTFCDIVDLLFNGLFPRPLCIIFQLVRVFPADGDDISPNPSRIGSYFIGNFIKVKVWGRREKPVGSFADSSRALGHILDKISCFICSDCFFCPRLAEPHFCCPRN